VKPAGSPELEVVAALDQAPGNVTVTPDGRVIMSLHQFFEPKMRVAELGLGGELVPFPNPEWAYGREGDVGVDAVLGIAADADGRVWMLDNGLRSRARPRLVAWDTEADALAYDIDLGFPATGKRQFVNDLVVDLDRGLVYIADPAFREQAALIVVDFVRGAVRRVLEGHESVVATGYDDPEMDLVIEGHKVTLPGPNGTRVNARVGVNPIALDSHGEWLYYGPMHGRWMYRVRADDLADASLTDAQLGARVERWAKRPISDGIAIDQAGNVYISEIGGNAIGVIEPDRGYRRLFHGPRLSWPDAFSFGPDGYMYTVANQLHLSLILSADGGAAPPFHVFRFKPLAPGVVGR